MAVNRSPSPPPPPPPLPFDICWELITYLNIINVFDLQNNNSEEFKEAFGILQSDEEKCDYTYDDYIECLNINL